MNRLATQTVKKNKDVQLKQPDYEALTIAKYLFSLDPKREYFNTKKISTGAGFSSVLSGNGRLNQILYLCQIFHYVKYGEFLFKDDLYAFDNGFIIYDVYRDFGTLYNKAGFLKTKDTIDKETKDFIKMIFHYFQGYSNKGLEEGYTNDPVGINSGLEKKKDPKAEFNPQTLIFYDNFGNNHLHHIEHHL